MPKTVAHFSRSQAGCRRLADCVFCLFALLLMLPALVLCFGCDSGGGGTPISGPGGQDPQTPSVVDVRREGGGEPVSLEIGDTETIRRLQGLDADPQARVRITSPRNGQIVRQNRIGVAVAVQHFLLGEDAPGQHVRLVLDGVRQLTHNDPSRTVWFEDVSNGWHVITACLAREQQLGLKNTGAHHYVAVFVSHDTVPPPDLDGPVLIYGQPDGEYSRGAGEADAILIDFQVLNVALGDGYTVRATLDDDAHVYTFDSHAPQVIIDRLSLGPHTLKLELLDAAGKVVDCPFCPATGKFRIVE